MKMYFFLFPYSILGHVNSFIYIPCLKSQIVYFSEQPFDQIIKKYQNDVVQQCPNILPNNVQKHFTKPLSHKATTQDYFRIHIKIPTFL